MNKSRKRHVAPIGRTVRSGAETRPETYTGTHVESGGTREFVPDAAAPLLLR